jgi:hypothetical protein
MQIGRCCGMEVNVEKKTKNGNLKAIVPETDYGKSKTTGERGLFKVFW